MIKIKIKKPASTAPTPEKQMFDEDAAQMIFKELNDIKMSIRDLNTRLSSCISTQNQSKQILIEMKKENIYRNSGDASGDASGGIDSNASSDASSGDGKLDKEMIIGALKSHSFTADLGIFRAYYLQSPISKPPVQLISARKFQYWKENEWHDDTYGKYIVDTAIANIKRCYQAVNKTTLFSQDDFLINCLYIQNMSEVKYQREFVKLLTKELN